MTPDRLATLLTRWGLDPAAIGPAETLALPEPLVDEARGTVRYSWPQGAAARIEPPPPPPLAVRSDVLEAAGLIAALEGEGRVLLLAGSEGLPFAVSADPRFEVARTGAEVRVALYPSSSFVIEAAAGAPLVVASIDRDGIHLRAVHAWPAPPLDAWLAAAEPADVAMMQERDDEGPSRWHETIVAGRIARLSRRADTRARIAALREGRDVGPSIAARTWLRALTPPQRSLIERFAIVQARRLDRELSQLQDRLRPGDATLAEAWRRLCHRRDDLEGLRVLLREAGSGDGLAAALQVADATGRAIRFSWPEDLDVHDERLRRVVEGDPAAWWGSTRYPLPFV